MNWDELRRQARQDVHRTFAYPAVYTPPGINAVPFTINARLHTRLARFGDLDREGYAQVVEDVNRVVLDLTEVTPQKKAKIDFGNGRVYTLDVFEGTPGEDLAEWRVKPL